LKQVEAAKNTLSPIKEFDRDEEHLTTCYNEEEEKYLTLRM
jgi:hypothetical protein